MTGSGPVVSHDPVERREDDRLGRADFAKLLARALATNPERRSMVVALYGDWGSGKTSTLNLCFEALNELPEQERPLVVRFNPWWFSNTGDLLVQFFARLGNDLEKKGKIKGIGKMLIRYGSMLAPTLGGVVDTLGGSGMGSAVGGLLSRVAKRSEEKAQQQAQDIHALRADITTALKGFERRIVVVIDDIDRLSAAEMRDIFKMVKAIADFPNTRYLLVFDFKTVSDALSEVQRTDGASYLEKIVQVPFRLPDPAPAQLMEIVKEGVVEIASRQQEISDEEKEQAREKLEHLAFYGLGSLWDNMRRVNRFLDSLSLTLPTIADEVRLSDFVLLEALRVIEPRVYETVLDGKNLLLGTGPGAEILLTRGSADAQEEINRATAALVDAACDATERRELAGVIRRILEDLFPRVGSATGGIGAYGSSFLDEWANEKRICVEEYFDIATRWSLAPGTINNSEVRSLVPITAPTDLRNRLRVYDHDDRNGVDFASALEKVDPFYRTEAGPPALEAIVRVVLGEERTDRSYPIMFLLAQDALKRLADPEQKMRILQESIEEHRVLPLMADLLKELGKEHGWFDRSAIQEEYRTLPSEQFQKIVEAAVDDLRKQAEDRILLERRPFDECLYFCRAAVGEKQPATYLRKLIRDEGSLPLLIKALIGEATARRIAEKEPVADESNVVQRLQPLRVFKVDAEARTRADELLAENASHDDRALLEWFVAAHEAAETPVENQ